MERTLKPMLGLIVKKPHFRDVSVMMQKLAKSATAQIFFLFFEKLFALVLIVLLTIPLLIILSIPIWIQTGGTPIFIQYREGKDGKWFPIFKFRTMRIGSRVANLTHSVDIRLSNKKYITPLGKFLRKTCIDEFPQFVNILLGHMSFVGPRPPAPEASKSNLHYIPRIKGIRPGLTGLEQLSPLRNDKTYNTEHFNYLYYKKRCVLLNLYILWKTAVFIFSGTKVSW